MSSSAMVESAANGKRWLSWFVVTGSALVLLGVVAAFGFRPPGLVIFACIPVFAAWAGACVALLEGRRRLLLGVLFPWGCLVLMTLLTFLPSVLRFGIGQLAWLVSWLGFVYTSLPLFVAYGMGFLSARFGRPGHAAPLVALAAALGLFAFAGNGVSIHASVPGVYLFPTTLALGLWCCRGKRPSVVVRLLVGVSLAYSLTWLGVLWNDDRFSWEVPQQYEAWLAEHGASTEFYETQVVTGFPLQAVEGHGGGGAPEWLPAEKGLYALIANFLLLVAVFVGAALAVPRPWLWTTAWATVALAAICGPLGWWELLWLLD